MGSTDFSSVLLPLAGLLAVCPVLVSFKGQTEFWPKFMEILWFLLSCFLLLEVPTFPSSHGCPELRGRELIDWWTRINNLKDFQEYLLAPKARKFSNTNGVMSKDAGSPTGQFHDNLNIKKIIIDSEYTKIHDSLVIFKKEKGRRGRKMEVLHF